ncbi:MAG: phosphatase PAP2 family protein [Opitutaceae bacterium]|nr:phosphatase PAP2 family protein [Opitutaceae bacterium]
MSPGPPAAGAKPRVGRGMRSRFGALVPEKLFLSLVLSTGFWLAYGVLSRVPPGRVRTLPRTPLDSWAPAGTAGWGWIYLSPFLLSGLLPWLIDRRDHLRAYVRCFLALSLPAFVCFALFPVASPRGTLDPGAGPVAWVRGADGPYNAFPSLHAGFLVLLGGLAARMVEFSGRSLPLRIGLGAVYLTWSAAVLAATLATGQHWVLDLVAGLALGFAAHRWAWRGVTRSGAGTPGTPG